MNCPPDVLCKWLGDRWETMEELAFALEIEAGKTRRVTRGKYEVHENEHDHDAA